MLPIPRKPQNAVAAFLLARTAVSVAMFVGGLALLAVIVTVAITAGIVLAATSP